MSKPSEEISQYYANSGGKTDSNLANDALHLGGIEAEEYATKKYVQDYHGQKEEVLKEQISNQDKAVLDEAKAYTDQVVAGQDFSSFAKLTDVQALDTKLQNKITAGDVEQKSYTDTQIQSVVDDTNANFDDVNQAITKLNNSTTELFQSVSNGKSLVAGAITDKGVSTSASDSFNTMATNIRSIPTSSGGSTGESGIDTSDATATAADILKGKTAYVDGIKVYGRYEATNNTEDNPDNPYPEYTEVKLVYESTADTIETKSYSNTASSYIHDISGDKQLCICYDSSNSKIKLYGKSNSSDGLSYIDTYTLKNANGDTYECKCPEYTLEDLGIDPGTVASIKFAPMNDRENESAYLTYLTISMKDISTSHIILYTFGVYTGTYTENDTYYKGKIYTTNELFKENEQVTSTSYRIWKYDTEIDSGNFVTMKYSPYRPEYTIGLLALIVSSNPHIYLYTMSYLLAESTDIANTEKGYGKTTLETTFYKLSTSLFDSGTVDNFGTIRFLNNNRVIEVVSTDDYGYGDTSSIRQLLFILDDNLNIIKGTDITITQGNWSGTVTITPYIITHDCLYAIKGTTVYSITINYTTGEVSFTELGTIDIDVGTSYVGYTSQINWWVSLDNSFIVSNGKVLKIDFIEITATQLLSGSYSITKEIINQKDLIVTSNSNKYLLYMNYDNKKVIGLKYNGDVYYKQIYPSGTLTAGQSDVKAGKTFIGYMGVPETGTMEVTE